MKELVTDFNGEQDYQETSPDVFDPEIKIGIPYTAHELLTHQDITDELKILKGEELSDDDVRWTIAVREMAANLGDNKIVFQVDEYGTLYTEFTK